MIAVAITNIVMITENVAITAVPVDTPEFSDASLPVKQNKHRHVQWQGILILIRCSGHLNHFSAGCTGLL